MECVAYIVKSKKLGHYRGFVALLTPDGDDSALFVINKTDISENLEEIQNKLKELPATIKTYLNPIEPNEVGISWLSELESANQKIKVLVLCTGNSCRSQMAEGYLRHFCQDNILVHSAGIEAHGLNSNAVLVMQEDGIDISKQTSNTISEYNNIDFDFVITVCDNAKENCPYFPSKAIKIHQNFTDPAKAVGTEEEVLNAFREVRDTIKEFCKEFIEKEIK